MPEFLFNPDGHIYTLDGVRLPSVTQVLEDVGIIDYSRIPGEIREHALERGRLVHLASAYDDEGDLDESSIDEEILRYLGGWRAFRSDTGFTPALIERRGWHPTYRYAGTLDRTGKFPKDKACRVLLDIKSGYAEDWVRFQLAAYCALFENPRTYRRICVEVHKDSTYKVIEFPSSDYQTDLNVFLSSLNVFFTKVELKKAVWRKAA